MSDREKLIEEMAKIICKPIANKGECDECGFKRSCSKFDDATAIYNAGFRKTNGWIPVTERLPQNSKERVIVKIKDAHNIIGDQDMDTDRYVVDSWVRWGENVTHWMPLPQAPKRRKTHETRRNS